MHQHIGEMVHSGDTKLIYGRIHGLACVESLSTGVYYVLACSEILAVCATKHAAMAAYHASRP
jgi:hypothetical protein